MKCLITGSSGYVGSRLRDFLKFSKHEVLELKRKASGGADEKWIPFSLEESIDPEALRGGDVLIHAAYDFRPLTWPDIERVNVSGSLALFKAARAAGIEKIIFISSVSAFDGCKSLYGRAKLAVEKAAAQMGAVIIRPGLVYGGSAGGMVGRLEKIIDKSKIIPVVGGSQKMFVCHEEDLARLVLAACNGECPIGQPILAASETQLTFQQILTHLSGKKGKAPTFIPVPAPFVWIGLKTLEMAGRPLGMRSDSLVSLMNSNPSPNFAPTRACGAQFRTFS